MEMILQWLDKNEVIDRLYGEGSNAYLVERSGELLRLMVEMGLVRKFELLCPTSGSQWEIR